jgi:glutaredoxin
MPLTLITAQGCPACTNLKKLLNGHGVPYREVDASMARKHYKYVPVIEVNGQSFEGGDAFAFVRQGLARRG